MREVELQKKDCFLRFESSVEGIALPSRFTFPFYYEPHSLGIKAAKELQDYLSRQTDWEHNFGLDSSQEGLGIGKMFGVLVVENKDGELGYLKAFSGKVADSNNHPHFVPPIYDMLTEGSYFNEGMLVLNTYNERIDELEASPDLELAKAYWAAESQKAERQLKEEREFLKKCKKERKIRREEVREQLSAEEFGAFAEGLKEESLMQQYYFKDLTRYWKIRLQGAQRKLNVLLDEINDLREKRKVKSAGLQKRLFSEYTFLNQGGERRSLLDIFQTAPQQIPPAGAGECAAPKLLQYAFLHGYRPIALTEFWWGQSPKSEVRKHKHYYPACRGKCLPILGHMLEGMDVDENPMEVNPAEGKTLGTIYEDEHLLVINKPTEFLSVPGKSIEDSVFLRIRQRYPEATGPLVVHRLDMSTSGLMMIAKTKEVHKKLQSQFIKRSIKKRYVAVLEGNIEGEGGYIDLPLRVDLDDRPRQLVCYEHGKSARTRWEVIEKQENYTRVYFYPITGRTHQLRVHAAHPSGLNAAIIGDDLYGRKGERLHLHAESITFKHPMTQEELSIQVDPAF